MFGVQRSVFDVPKTGMKSLFITFEGTEGCGKSTQIEILANRLRALGRRVCVLREPGGTPIGDEIRHTLKHSQQNHAMMAETELLLMNASRATRPRNHPPRPGRWRDYRVRPFLRFDDGVSGLREGPRLGAGQERN